jgi:cytidylate kinase
MHRVIAIDGPSGSGKSTVSRIVAERLGFRFLDTGALYRAVALHLRRHGIDPDDPDDRISGSLQGLSLRVDGDKVCLSGEDVSDAIRTTAAGRDASVFSARRVVRDHLFRVQRDALNSNDIVAEGRDMTTVVFPDAWKKFFLDASEEERARRRFAQLSAKGMTVSIEEALRDVQERDRRDSSRDVAPLRRAEDAIYINTTNMTLDEVIEKIISNLPHY